MTDNKFETILEMIFLKFHNADILFNKKTFIQKFYTTNKRHFITKQVQIIDKTNFIIAALNVNNKIIVMYIAICKQEKMAINFIIKAQIEI